MKTLDEAWAWYRAVTECSKRLTHLAKFWDDLPWEGGQGWVAELARDNVLRAVSATEMASEANRVQDEINDLAVLVFSVFEAIVRDWVSEQVKPEVAGLHHPALKRAGEDVLVALAEGSFYRVLEPYKSAEHGPLIEQVHQVRRYRNWVAHGRRPENVPNEFVRPEDAHKRLKDFLTLIQPAVPAAPS